MNLPDAADPAERAAVESGISLRGLHTSSDLAEASALLAEVWGMDLGDTPVPNHLLRAFVHAGNYVAGAFADGAMIGVSVGFISLATHGLALHSHITGVKPTKQTRNVGYAMKQHQRSWALARGIRTIMWTFDPLVRRNAYFNLVKLGADLVGYRPNFYDPERDSVNDKELDRCIVSWSLESPRSRAAAAGRHAVFDEEALLADGGKVVLDVDESGRPLAIEAEGEVLLCRVPEDIVQMRTTEPEVAALWRFALRDCMHPRLGGGFKVLSMTRSGCYVLAH